MPQVYAYLVETPEYPAEAQRAAAVAFFTERLMPQFLTMGILTEQPGGWPRELARRPVGAALSGLQPGDHLIVPWSFAVLASCLGWLVQLGEWQRRGVVLHLLDLDVLAGGPVEGVERQVVEALGKIGVALTGRRAEAARWRARQLQDRGRFIGGAPPYGYKVRPWKDRRHLVPDPAMRTWGRRFLAWRREGWSWNKIRLHLTVTRQKWQGRAFTRTLIQRWCAAEAKLQAAEAAEVALQAETSNGCSAARSGPTALASPADSGPSSTSGMPA